MTRMRARAARRWAGLLAGLWGLGGPAAGAREPGRLAVVELASPSSMVGLSAQVAQALQREARAQGVAVVAPEAVRRTLGEEGVGRLHACRGSPECVALRARPLGVARLVVGTLERDATHYRLALHLVDVGAAREVAALERSVLIASGRLRRDVEEALPALLRGQAPARGTLKLTASVPGAQVEVEEAVVGTTPLALPLAPGQHRVRLTKAGYWPVERLVTVEAGRTTAEQVRLVRQPGPESGAEGPDAQGPARPR